VHLTGTGRADSGQPKRPGKADSAQPKRAGRADSVHLTGTGRADSGQPKRPGRRLEGKEVIRFCPREASPCRAQRRKGIHSAGRDKPAGKALNGVPPKPAQPSSVPSGQAAMVAHRSAFEVVNQRGSHCGDALGRSVRSSAWPLTPDGDPSCLPAVSTLFCPVPAEEEARFRRALRVRHRKGVVRPKGFLPLRKRNGQKVSASLCQPKNFSGAVARSLHR
jgi:hypothetical protein